MEPLGLRPQDVGIDRRLPGRVQRIKLTPSCWLVTPEHYTRQALSVLEGRYSDPPRSLHDEGPHRVLDIGAGVGEFACWVWARWPRAWIDCIEPRAELLPFLAHNLPPGARLLGPDAEIAISSYDLVRVGLAYRLPESLSMSKPKRVIFDYEIAT